MELAGHHEAGRPLTTRLQGVRRVHAMEAIGGLAEFDRVSAGRHHHGRRLGRGRLRGHAQAKPIASAASLDTTIAKAPLLIEVHLVMRLSLARGLGPLRGAADFPRPPVAFRRCDQQKLPEAVLAVSAGAEPRIRSPSPPIGLACTRVHANVAAAASQLGWPVCLVLRCPDNECGEIHATRRTPP